MFYSTNTNGIINLKGVTLSNASGVLLKAGADQWGTTGSNGSDITFNADSQTLTGDVVLDNISTVSLNLKNNSSLKGTINSDNTAKSITVTLDDTSTWNVTGNSYITSLTDDDATLANINDNGYTIYYNSNDSKSSWLNGKTYTLKDGGKLTPMTTSN
jgi:3-phenylpropionate/cinnamic acid dioxygenase small subunit